VGSRPSREHAGLVTQDPVSYPWFFAGSRRTRRSSGAPNSVPLLGSLLAPLVGARSALSLGVPKEAGVEVNHLGVLRDEEVTG
jgi:hypothetical protein